MWVVYDDEISAAASDASAERDGIKSADLPPLKWSSLKYVLTMEDEINGEEEAYG